MNPIHKTFLKIGLIQMRCEKGGIDENLESLAEYVAEAERKGIDIVGFPEACITGYINPLKYPQAVISTDGAEVDALLRMTRGRKPTVLAGLIENNSAGKPFITQVIVSDGKATGLYRKRIIGDAPDADWFSPGNEVKVFKYGNVKYGMAICADIGGEDIFAEYARQGAQIIFELAAPGLLGEQATRDWRAGYEWWEEECRKHLEGYAKKYGIWIAVATQAGRTIDEDFPGGGYVFAPDGTRVYATKDWSPGAVYLEIDLERNIIKELPV
jgi:predicted amidohydrolase